MRVLPVKKGKWDYLSLLLLADPEPRMIDRYLDRGELWVLEDGGKVRSLCVVTDEGEGICELKNLATGEEDQRKGYGTALVEEMTRRYASRFHTMVVGTGESPLTIPFYEKLGFVVFRREEGFFTRNYPDPIWEAGQLLTDMIYLRRRLGEER